MKQGALDGMRKENKQTALLDSSAINYPLLQSNSLFDSLQFAFARDWVSAWKLTTVRGQRRQCNSNCKSSLKKQHRCSQLRTLSSQHLKTRFVTWKAAHSCFINACNPDKQTVSKPITNDTSPLYTPRNGGRLRSMCTSELSYRWGGMAAVLLHWW